MVERVLLLFILFVHVDGGGGCQYTSQCSDTMHMFEFILIKLELKQCIYYFDFTICFKILQQ